MYAFSLFISIGVVLGLSWTVADLKEKQAFRFIDCSLGILLGGLIGARAVFVAVHWVYFQEHLLEVFKVWTGGFSATGALWGGFVVWLIYAGLKIQHPITLTDQLFPAFMLVAVTTWLGCWLEGVAYGPIGVGRGWGLLARDEWGAIAARFPTQLLGAFLTLGWFWFLEMRRKRQKQVPGWTAAWGLLGISAIYTSLSFLRADPVIFWQGIRLDTWGGLSLIILSLTCILLRRRFYAP